MQVLNGDQQDLTVLDTFLWGNLKNTIYGQHQYNIVADLRDNTIAEFKWIRIRDIVIMYQRRRSSFWPLALIFFYLFVWIIQLFLLYSHLLYFVIFSCWLFCLISSLIFGYLKATCSAKFVSNVLFDCCFSAFN